MFRGVSIGVTGTATGEVVFNTAMTGYQEILTDPSYARQIVTLTYPHVGNTGTNPGDLESREVLLAKLAGAMKAAPQNAVSLLAAPLSQAARLFAALQDKLQAEGGAEEALNAQNLAKEGGAQGAAEDGQRPAVQGKD